MNLLEMLLLLLPLVAGAWAAWWVPRWAGRPRRRDDRPGTVTGWSVGDLPSVPYNRLPRLR